MRLLYAEDEPALSEAVVDYLTYHKYIVDAVYDGEEAYDYAISGEYDGIILDIMMPKKDGLEVLQLPKQEYRLMEQLMLNHTMYMSTEDLLIKAWGFNTETDINSVWLYISYLRKRLGDAGSSV